jgi:hypothetical protein
MALWIMPSLSFRGASEASEPGIQPLQGVWIPGLRQAAHPGMTVVVSKKRVASARKFEEIVRIETQVVKLIH